MVASADIQSLKIITLHQPWASLVALGLKKHETRHWSTTYRGPLLIHAAALKMTHEAREVLINAVLHANKPAPVNLPLGCIVASVWLSGCARMVEDESSHDDWEDPFLIRVGSVSELERSVGLWEPGRYALKLDNVRPLPNPIPFKSRQGKLLDAPAEIIAAVQQQLQEVA